MNYPTSVRSWTLLSETIAVKYMDRSTFLHNGTGIPRQRVASFFNLRYMKLSTRINIKIKIKDALYNAYFERLVTGRIRLKWGGDVASILIKHFPDYYEGFSSGRCSFDRKLQMYFEFIKRKTYRVDFKE
jgi:5-methylcytosine-specific restriction enzyme A